MKKLVTTTDRIELGFIQGVLESEGIPCLVKNEFLGGASGELPVNEIWPEIWVANDDWQRGQQVLAAMQPNGEAKSWHCDQCGELMAPQFAVCWRCADGATPD